VETALILNGGQISLIEESVVWEWGWEGTCDSNLWVMKSPAVDIGLYFSARFQFPD
jgi:hypothetical protein